MKKLRQIVANIISILLAIITASHHWMHLLILMILGTSTSMMAMMSTFIWVRRLMILVTVITSLYSLYQLFTNKLHTNFLRVFTLISVVGTMLLVVYSFISFGF